MNALEYRLARIVLFGVVAVLLVFISAAKMMDSGTPSDEQMLQQQYCEMVDIWDRSKGEHGWPPYRGRELCN